MQQEDITMPNNDEPAPPTWAAQLELTEDTIKYERRRRTVAIISANGYFHTYWDQRRIRSKKYEGTIRDVDPAVAELPAPAYLAGDNIIELNPESLSPPGYGTGQWHAIDVQYTKNLEEPMSRRYSITWEQYGAWETIEQESDSQ